MNINSVKHRNKLDESSEGLHVMEGYLCVWGQPKGNQAISAAITNFDSLPDAAHVRLPVMKILYGCSSATIWRGVKSGRIPAPRHLAARVTAWNTGEIRQALANIK